MKLHSLAFAFISIGFLSACVPLQQAPLVYSSKVVVGIDVSANVAENQGGSINIGVKTVDSAYVPVAVSKEVDKLSQDKKTHVIEIIEAKYGEGSRKGRDGASDPEGNKKIDEFFLARQAAEVASAARASSENTLGNLKAVEAELITLKSGITSAQTVTRALAPEGASGPAATPLKNEALSKRAEDVTKFNREKGGLITPLTIAADGTSNAQDVLSSIDKSIGSVRDSIDKTAALLTTQKTEQQTKMQEAARAKEEALKVTGLSETTKTDAMSVYGRFDSNGGGETKTDGVGAKLLVGKVFSTGLASQNLTEAVKLESNSRCIEWGIKAAEMIKNDEAARAALLGGLKNICVIQAATPK